MKIAIDISQLAYKNTGVAQYLGNLVSKMIENDRTNEYILFFSSMRGSINNLELNNASNVKIKKFNIYPVLLDLIWNKLHIIPIEWFVGDIDLVITSDWTEPPARRAMKATILYDVIVYKYPDETDKKIVDVQKRKLEWVKKESDMVFCISEATKKDVIDILKIDPKKIQVVYPGF